jgi:hypothetical protein
MIRFHGISPQDTLKLSIPEIELYLEEGWENTKSKMQMHIDLKCAILNGSHFHKKDDKPYEWKDFLPKDFLPEKAPRRELSKEEKAAMWSAAGNAFVGRCEDPRKKVSMRKKGSKRLPSQSKSV